MCIRDIEIGSEAQEFLENQILSAYPPKGNTRGKRRVTNTEGKEQLEKVKVVGRRQRDWEDCTILQLLILGEGPVWQHVRSDEYCPGVLQHLREPHLAEWLCRQLTDQQWPHLLKPYFRSFVHTVLPLNPIPLRNSYSSFS